MKALKVMGTIDDRVHPVTLAKSQPTRRRFPIPELAGKATTLGDIVSPIC